MNKDGKKTSSFTPRIEDNIDEDTKQIIPIINSAAEKLKTKSNAKLSLFKKYSAKHRAAEQLIKIANNNNISIAEKIQKLNEYKDKIKQLPSSIQDETILSEIEDMLTKIKQHSASINLLTTLNQYEPVNNNNNNLDNIEQPQNNQPMQNSTSLPPPAKYLDKNQLITETEINHFSALNSLCFDSKIRTTKNGNKTKSSGLLVQIEDELSNVTNNERTEQSKTKLKTLIQNIKTTINTMIKQSTDQESRINPAISTPQSLARQFGELQDGLAEYKGEIIEKVVSEGFGSLFEKKLMLDALLILKNSLTREMNQILSILKKREILKNNITEAYEKVLTVIDTIMKQIQPNTIQNNNPTLNNDFFADIERNINSAYEMLGNDNSITSEKQDIITKHLENLVNSCNKVISRSPEITYTLRAITEKPFALNEEHNNMQDNMFEL